MKKLLYILFFFFLPIAYCLLPTASCFSQNLVSNPSFEQFDTCPNMQDQIIYATGWTKFNQYSPDYFNSCSTNPWFSVPYNWGGYQLAADGNAYAGIYTYETPQPPIDTLLREYIGAQLLVPLVMGTKYYFSFKTNLAIDTNHIFNQATNNLGMLFSTVPYSPSNPTPTKNFAHVYSAFVITDTMNWTTISGSFITDSAYQYISIGNFFDDVNTIVIQQQDTISDKSAYYYIDDVYVSTDSISGGIAEQDAQGSIIIYPNPFAESSNVKINCNCSFNNSTASIFDFYGREVKTYSFSNKEMGIDRDGLLTGIYFLKLEVDNKMFTQKLIITN